MCLQHGMKALAAPVAEKNCWLRKKASKPQRRGGDCMSTEAWYSRPKALFVAVLACVALSGCTSSEEYKDLLAANERIAALLRTIAENEQKIAARDAELATVKASDAKDFEAIQTRHRDELSRRDEQHRTATAELEKRNSELMLELGASEKQRIALQEMVDQPKTVEAAERQSFAVERFVWLMLLLLPTVASFFLLSRYLHERGKTRDALVGLIGQMKMGELDHA